MICSCCLFGPTTLCAIYIILFCFPLLGPVATTRNQATLNPDMECDDDSLRGMESDTHMHPQLHKIKLYFIDCDFLDPSCLDFLFFSSSVQNNRHSQVN